MHHLYVVSLPDLRKLHTDYALMPNANNLRFMLHRFTARAARPVQPRHRDHREYHRPDLQPYLRDTTAFPGLGDVHRSIDIRHWPHRASVRRCCGTGKALCGLRLHTTCFPHHRHYHPLRLPEEPHVVVAQYSRNCWPRHGRRGPQLTRRAARYFRTRRGSYVRLGTGAAAAKRYV